MSVSRSSLALLPVLVLSGAAAAQAAPSTLPASKAVVITDQAGDANGINSQSHVADGVPSVAGPGQRTAADILSVTVGRLDNGKQATGLLLTMKLSAAPDQGTIYRIQSSTPDCTQFWISYNFPAGGSGAGSMRENCTGTAVTKPIPATVKDGVITFALPYAVLPKAVKAGTVISEIFGETKGHASTPAASPTAPTIDDTVVAPAGYTVGR